MKHRTYTDEVILASKGIGQDKGVIQGFKNQFKDMSVHHPFHDSFEGIKLRWRKPMENIEQTQEGEEYNENDYVELPMAQQIIDNSCLDFSTADLWDDRFF